jgi:hypothetical protein
VSTPGGCSIHRTVAPTERAGLAGQSVLDCCDLLLADVGDEVRRHSGVGPSNSRVVNCLPSANNITVTDLEPSGEFPVTVVPSLPISWANVLEPVRLSAGHQRSGRSCRWRAALVLGGSFRTGSPREQ